MGLNNYPHPYPCKKLGIVVFTEEEKIDCDRTIECPFRNDDTLTGIFGTSCWYRGNTLSRELQAIGMDDLASDCYRDMNSAETSRFANKLGRLADMLEKRSDDIMGAGWNGTVDLTTDGIHWDTYSSKSEVISAIRTGALWYGKVSGIGCGVKTWY